MRKLAVFALLALSGCNTAGTQQLINDVGVIAGQVAVVECAKLTLKTPLAVQSCTTLAGDVITVAQAQAQGLIAKK